jgi:hypothetical protein
MQKRYAISVLLGLTGFGLAFAAFYLFGPEPRIAGVPFMVGIILFFGLLTGTCLGLALEKGAYFFGCLRLGSLP